MDPPPCGCWIYCGVRADGINQAARRKPDASRTGWRRNGAGHGRPTAGSSTTGRRLTRTASPGASARRWSGGTPAEPVGRAGRARLRRRPAAVLPRAGREPPGSPRSPAPTRSSCRPTARRGCSPRPAWSTARCPPTTSRRSRPFRNLVYGQQHNPVRQLIRHPENRYQPSGDEPGSGVFPYVTTTYRLTEHHTAGGMSTVPALPLRAAARVLLRGLAAARRRARP